MRRRSQPPPLAEINLLPMMDVLLCVLTFFIIISMTLTAGQPVIEVTLPSTDSSEPLPPDSELPDPLIIGLNTEGQIVLQDQTLDETALTAELQAYFQSTPKGIVLLQADQKLPYEKIAQVLGRLRAVGGDRVALAVDQPESP